MFSRFIEFLLRLTGTTGAEVSRYHPSVRGRRLRIGGLIVIAGLCGGVLITLAVARIDPDNPARWFYALAAGALYAWVIVAYDSLFVAAASGAKARSVWPRVAMTIVMTAFTAITIDALVFGDRLLAEIDRTRTLATIEAGQRHAEVHDLDGKGRVFDGAKSTLTALEQELAGEPPTAEFEQAVADTAAAMEALKEERAAGTPRISALQEQIKQLRQQLADLRTEPDEDRQATLSRRIGEARLQIRDLQGRIQQRQRDLNAAANRADEIRRAWRADKLEQRQRALADTQAAQTALSAARGAAEEDVRKSAAVHEKAYQASLVEETMAFWSLALRETKYLVMGAILWLVAAFIELLGILARLWLDRDELDADRCEQTNRAILEAETREQIARDQGALRAVREARAKTESDAFFEALKFKQEASQRVSQALVSAFVRLQRERDAVTDPQARASLELQFACLQAALDRHIASLFAPSTGAAAPDPGTTAADPTAAASATPPAAMPSPMATGKTIVL
jgi:hypothetical protein